MVEKGFEQQLFLFCGLKPKPDSQKHTFEMLKHFQDLIFLLKLCQQFSQDTKHTFEEEF